MSSRIKRRSRALFETVVLDPGAGGPITRRALLGGGAAWTLAAALEGAPAALARAAGGHFTVALDGVRFARDARGRLVSEPVRAPHAFSVVGLRWRVAPPGHAELRVRRRGGAWSEWAAAGGAHAPDGAAAPAGGEPVWVGRADELQVRVSDRAEGLVAACVTAAADGPVGAAAAALAFLPAFYAGQPAIVGREAWALGRCLPSVAPALGTVEFACVHHTETPNGYGAAQVPAALRAIFRYHRFFNGWHDIGYNFVVDRFGRIFEARAGGIDEPIVGAHAGGFNAASTGVALLGSYGPRGPSAAAQRALTRLLAWKLPLHGAPVTGRVQTVSDGGPYTRYGRGRRVMVHRVAGHRDVDSTSCPGAAAYRGLPRLRAAAAARAPAALSLALDGPPERVVFAAPQTVAGRLLDAAGAGVAAAEIAVEARIGLRTERLATATTGADGSWSAFIALKASALVRARFAGAGRRTGALSAYHAVSVLPAVTVSADRTIVPAGEAVVLSATTQPPARRMTIVVERVELDGTVTVVARVHLRARAGRASQAVTLAEPGSYVAVAEVPGSVSPGVTIQVPAAAVPA